MRLNYEFGRRVLLEGSRLQFNAVLIASTVALAALVGIVVADIETVLAGCWCGIEDVLWLAPAAGAAATAIYWFALLPLRAWTIHRQNPLLFGAMELTADDDGFAMRAPRAESRFQWSDLQGFKENRAVILLRLSKSAGVIVPKGEAVQGDLPGFQALIASKLKRL